MGTELIWKIDIFTNAVFECIWKMIFSDVETFYFYVGLNTIFFRCKTSYGVDVYKIDSFK